jgi:hypothetical protein
MRYVQYLRLAGACAILLGLALTLLALPGVFLHYPAWWAGLLFVPGTLLVLGGKASRRGSPLGEPGRWLTDRPLRGARPGRDVVAAPILRRQILGETGACIVGAGAWIVLIGGIGLVFFGAGLALLAYGVLELFFSAPHIVDVEKRRRVRFRIHRRSVIGAPELTS